MKWVLCSRSFRGTSLPQIEYSAGAELAGATPAFVPAVLTFVEVMRRWQEGGITVPAAHMHVVRLYCSIVAAAPVQCWS